MDFSTIIGSFGVALLLIAFFLNLKGILKSNSLIYLWMNAIGAGISCYASFLIDYLPFVILEATWTGVAVYGIFSVHKKKHKMIVA